MNFLYLQTPKNYQITPWQQDHLKVWQLLLKEV